jgi:hypothetical protein
LQTTTAAMDRSQNAQEQRRQQRRQRAQAILQRRRDAEAVLSKMTSRQPYTPRDMATNGRLLHSINSNMTVYVSSARNPAQQPLPNGLVNRPAGLVMFYYYEGIWSVHIIDVERQKAVVFDGTDTEKVTNDGRGQSLQRRLQFYADNIYPFLQRCWAELGGTGPLNIQEMGLFSIGIAEYSGIVAVEFACCYVARKETVARRYSQYPDWDQFSRSWEVQRDEIQEAMEDAAESGEFRINWSEDFLLGDPIVVDLDDIEWDDE